MHIWLFTGLLLHSVHLEHDVIWNVFGPQFILNSNLRNLTLSATFDFMSIQVSAALCQNIPTVFFSLNKKYFNQKEINQFNILNKSILKFIQCIMNSLIIWNVQMKFPFVVQFFPCLCVQNKCWTCVSQNKTF